MSDAASLFEQGIIDSTGALEVIACIEETYGVTVEDDEMRPENLESIDCIARFVGRKQAARGAVLQLAS